MTIALGGESMEIGHLGSAATRLPLLPFRTTNGGITFALVGPLDFGPDLQGGEGGWHDAWGRSPAWKPQADGCHARPVTVVHLCDGRDVTCHVISCHHYDPLLGGDQSSNPPAHHHYGPVAHLGSA